MFASLVATAENSECVCVCETERGKERCFVFLISTVHVCYASLGFEKINKCEGIQTDTVKKQALICM